MPTLTVSPPFGPGSPSGGATGLTRRGIINQFSAGGMSPAALMTWSQMGYKPSHAGNILSMLQNSNCCPGAMTSMRPGADPNDLSSGARQVSCGNGTVYKMENWQGGVRARRVIGTGPAHCDTVGDYSGWGAAEPPRGSSGRETLRSFAWIGGAILLAAVVRPLIPNPKYRQMGSLLLGGVGATLIEKTVWPRK